MSPDELQPLGLNSELAIALYPTPVSPLDNNALNSLMGDEDDMEMGDATVNGLEDLDELLKANGSESQKIMTLVETKVIKPEFNTGSNAFNITTTNFSPTIPALVIPPRPAFLTSSTIPAVQSYSHSQPTASTSALPIITHLPTPVSAKLDSTFEGQQSIITRSPSPKTEASPAVSPPPIAITKPSSPTSLERKRSFSKTPPPLSSSPRKGHFTSERQLFPETKWPPAQESKTNSREQSVKMESEESVSGNSTPTGESKKQKGKKVKKEDDVVQLIGDLAIANEKALESFIEIPDCTYYSKALGNNIYSADDSMLCDCGFDENAAPSEQACGDDSQCMNRLMQIECNSDCRCSSNCQNDRFVTKQYAKIDIVHTEKKGFGVRTRENLKSDSFIYEYVGEVIGPAPFARRMKDYGKEGIKHFYFMALDKEIFIDATKKGGLGRFLNHSCNPNCYVAKWTVGKKMRMGIFAKRDIAKDEELTFNYNVDRYGHVAQECYCGESNCVGFIGGKTQTDIGGMDELYIDALGIKDEVDALELRGTKKKKGKKLDVDFTPILKAITLEETGKVSAALRQAITNRKILIKLLQRIAMTKDEEVQRAVCRLHGFVLMVYTLREYPMDVEIVVLTFQVLSLWPMIHRNKIESTKIEDSVRNSSSLEDPRIQELSKSLLTTWESLTLAYRIPREIKEIGEASDKKRVAEPTIQALAKRARYEDELILEEEVNRPVFVRPEASRPLPRAPKGWTCFKEDGRYLFRNDVTKKVQTFTPSAHQVESESTVSTPKASPIVAMDINAIIAEAQAVAEADETAAAESKKELEDAQKLLDGERRKEKKSLSAKSSKEKKIMGLFGAVVVKVMSKYRAELDADQFKKRAKEVTLLLSEKEKRHPNYETQSYNELSPEKILKVSAFTKEWVKKLISRSKSSPHRSNSHSNSKTSSSSSSKSRHTPSTKSKSHLPNLSSNLLTPSASPLASTSATPDGPSTTSKNLQEDEDLASILAELVDENEEEMSPERQIRDTVSKPIIEPLADGKWKKVLEA